MKFLVLLMIGLLDATYASRCIGYCDIFSDLLAHEDCDKYCECTLFGDPIEYSCEHGLHFSFEFQDCVHPSLAGCRDVSEPSVTTPAPTRPPSTSVPVTPSPPVDNNGCIGKCPPTNSPDDYVVHLEHKEFILSIAVMGVIGEEIENKTDDSMILRPVNLIKHSCIGRCPITNTNTWSPIYFRHTYCD
ncbi:Protein of unknown function [Cotesia congregata]|uniref:Chitin-binding type-2 domain-containing protein n=1 Tax=Cotesia congregata TaxID=51543 RepID=A0A8J2MQD9_COTCN|nr:Protein of unknown function [Cotesia congregata]